MNTLLYVRTSLYGAQGASSQLAERFVAEWRTRNPGGRVIERDLAADPVPHLTAERFQAFGTPAESRTTEQQAVVAYSDALIDELRSAASRGGPCGSDGAGLRFCTALGRCAGPRKTCRVAAQGLHGKVERDVQG